MSKLAWTPWHKVVKIRPDLKSGELSLNIFAADLYDVAMGKAKPVYQDAREFFSLTYPTFNLRELAKDVVTAAGRQERQGRPPARTDLRRRQDPLADHAVASGQRPGATSPTCPP